MSVLKFKFDGNLDYQQRAIESVVGLFEGQPLANETYSVSIGTQEGGSQLALGDGEFSNIAAVANQLVLTDELLLENLHKIQEDNNRCQPWRAKRRLVDPSSREAALFSRRALRQRENKVGLRTRRPVIWESSTEQQRACEVVA